MRQSKNQQAANGELTPGSLVNDMLAEDAGRGLGGMRQEDFAVPRLTILQKLSAAASPGDPSYIEGARSGDIYDSVNHKLYKGSEGVLLLLINFRRSYTEWKSRDAGGGFVRDHGEDSSIMDQTDRGYPPLLENGNEIQFAMEYFAFLMDPRTGDFDRVIVSLSKSQLKKARMLNSQLLNTMVSTPGGRRPAPMFYKTYRFKTVLESSHLGSWYGWCIKAEVPVLELPGGTEIYEEARAFNVAVNGATPPPPTAPPALTAGADDHDNVPL